MAGILQRTWGHASATVAGVVNTVAQTFAGPKTFQAETTTLKPAAGANIEAGLSFDATNNSGGTGKSYDWHSDGASGEFRMAGNTDAITPYVYDPDAANGDRHRFQDKVGFGTDGANDGRPWFTVALTPANFSHNLAPADYRFAGIVLNGAGPGYPSFGLLDPSTAGNYLMKTAIPIPMGVQGDVRIQVWAHDLEDSSGSDSTLKLASYCYAIGDGGDLDPTTSTQYDGTQVTITNGTAATISKKVYDKYILGVIGATHDQLVLELFRVAPDTGTEVSTDIKVHAVAVQFRMKNLGY